MKNWNADEWHLFLCQHCDNRATSPNGLNKVALAIVDEIDEVTAAKRRALKMADERAIEANEMRQELERVRNAGLQALRQWKMYSETEEGFEKSAEGSIYLACKALLTDEVREPRTGAGSLD